MRKYQLKLVDRQCRMSELSSKVQKLIIILATSLYAARSEDEVIRASADIICRDLKREILRARTSDRYYRQVTKLGGMIAEGGFPGLPAAPDEIMMKY